MNQQLSDWSEQGEKPPCVGVWETNVFLGSRAFQYFDGTDFRAVADSPYNAYYSRSAHTSYDQSKIRFRGMVEPPSKQVCESECDTKPVTNLRDAEYAAIKAERDLLLYAIRSITRHGQCIDDLMWNIDSARKILSIVEKT